MGVKETIDAGAAWDEAHERLAAQIAGIVCSRLLDPLEILLGAGDGLRDRVEREARQWTMELLGPDDAVAMRTAIRLVCSLYPGDRPFDPPVEWWATPLGRAVAARAGHPAAEAVSYSVAGAMLGVTRQAVHDLVSRGKLQRGREGGVTVESVRARMNRRSDLAAKAASR